MVGDVTVSVNPGELCNMEVVPNSRSEHLRCGSASQVSEDCSDIPERITGISQECTGKVFSAKKDALMSDKGFESGRSAPVGGAHRPPSQGSDFDVPPSPGHTQPSLETLSTLHRQLLRGAQLCNRSLHF